MSDTSYNNGSIGNRGVVLSLFTGAGGLDLGLEAAGLQTVAYIESDEDCLATLDLNRPSWKRLEPFDAVKAAKRLHPSDAGLEPGEVDILAAGPPCQPFSYAAQWRSSGRRGMQDDRAATVHATVGFVRRFQPRVLLIENVVGFVRSDHGAMRVLQRGLERVNRDLGTRYALHHHVLDAADYGVPQHRRRAIVVASRDGNILKPPEATHRNRPMRAWDAIGDLPDPASAARSSRHLGQRPAPLDPRRRELPVADRPWGWGGAVRLSNSLLVLPPKTRKRSAVMDAFSEPGTVNRPVPLE